MNIKTYVTEAPKTAFYRGTEKGGVLDSLLTGLEGEMGELQNYVKKINRDRNNVITEEDYDYMREELGDICWYMANIYHNEMSEWQPIQPCWDYAMRSAHTNYRDYKDYSPLQILRYLNQSIASFDYHMDGDFWGAYGDDSFGMEQSLIRILEALIAVANYFDFEIEGIFQSNIDKVQRRMDNKQVTGEWSD